jgi:hypothetical protein
MSVGWTIFWVAFGGIAVIGALLFFGKQNGHDR